MPAVDLALGVVGDQQTAFGPDVAGLIASANFAGYLAGSMLVAFVASRAARLWVFRIALAASVVTTIAMGLTSDLALWLILRTVSGLASAGAMIMAPGLVQAQQLHLDPAKVMGPDAWGECHKSSVAAWKGSHHFSTFKTLPRLKEARAIGKAVVPLVEEGLGMFERSGNVEVKSYEDTTVYQVVPKQRAAMDYYKNTIMHAFAREGFSADLLFAHYKADIIYLPHPHYKELSEKIQGDPRFKAGYDFYEAQSLPIPSVMFPLMSNSIAQASGFCPLTSMSPSSTFM